MCCSQPCTCLITAALCRKKRRKADEEDGPKRRAAAEAATQQQEHIDWEQELSDAARAQMRQTTAALVAAGAGKFYIHDIVSCRASSQPAVIGNAAEAATQQQEHIDWEQELSDAVRAQMRQTTAGLVAAGAGSACSMICVDGC